MSRHIHQSFRLALLQPCQQSADLEAQHTRPVTCCLALSERRESFDTGQNRKLLRLVLSLLLGLGYRRLDLQVLRMLTERLETKQCEPSAAIPSDCWRAGGTTWRTRPLMADNSWWHFGRSPHPLSLRSLWRLTKPIPRDRTPSCHTTPCRRSVNVSQLWDQKLFLPFLIFIIGELQACTESEILENLHKRSYSFSYHLDAITMLRNRRV